MAKRSIRMDSATWENALRLYWLIQKLAFPQLSRSLMALTTCGQCLLDLYQWELGAANTDSLWSISKLLYSAGGTRADNSSCNQQRQCRVFNLLPNWTKFRRSFFVPHFDVEKQICRERGSREINSVITSQSPRYLNFDEPFRWMNRYRCPRAGVENSDHIISVCRNVRRQTWKY